MVEFQLRIARATRGCSRATSAGFTLIEAILATFLLVGTFYMVSHLFQTGLQYSVKVENRLVAVYLAEKRMAELQEWDKAGWTVPAALSGRDATMPTYDITVSLSDHNLLAPSTHLEAAFPGNQRVIDGRVRYATVTVRWGQGGEYQLTGMLRQPDIGWRATNPVVVTATSSPPPGGLGPSGSANFSAQGFDSAGQPISGLMLHWSVEPVFAVGPGVGSVRLLSRDGRNAALENRVKTRAGWVSTSGQCRVVATAKYKGIEMSGRSDVITLVKI